jgi:hypothetical protein
MNVLRQQESVHHVRPAIYWSRGIPLPPRIALLALIAASALAADWPQFLGPARNGVYSGNDLAAKWPPAGRPSSGRRTSEGLQQPVVADGRVILFHRLGAKVVEALDAATGRNIWTFEYPTQYRDDFGFDEGPPRRLRWPQDASTPSAPRALHCLDFATGKDLEPDTHKHLRLPGILAPPERPGRAPGLDEYRRHGSRPGRV